MIKVSWKPKIKVPKLFPIAASAPAVLTDLPKGSETVLVAEDEAIVRGYMVSILTELGYNVFEAADGEEALRISHGILDGKIDLLLADIVMPKMSGKELAYRVGQFFPQTKIVFCSGYPEKLAARNGMIDPTIPFLQKPVSPQALAFKVREILDAAKMNFDQEPTLEVEDRKPTDPPDNTPLLVSPRSNRHLGGQPERTRDRF